MTGRISMWTPRLAGSFARLVAVAVNLLAACLQSARAPSAPARRCLRRGPPERPHGAGSMSQQPQPWATKAARPIPWGDAPSSLRGAVCGLPARPKRGRDWRRAAAYDADRAGGIRCVPSRSPPARCSGASGAGVGPAADERGWASTPHALRRRRRRRTMRETGWLIAAEAPAPPTGGDGRRLPPPKRAQAPAAAFAAFGPTQSPGVDNGGARHSPLPYERIHRRPGRGAIKLGHTIRCCAHRLILDAEQRLDGHNKALGATCHTARNNVKSEKLNKADAAPRQDRKEAIAWTSKVIGSPFCCPTSSFFSCLLRETSLPW